MCGAAYCLLLWVGRSGAVGGTVAFAVTAPAFVDGAAGNGGALGWAAGFGAGDATPMASFADRDRLGDGLLHWPVNQGWF